jgi:hypothetical protein
VLHAVWCGRRPGWSRRRGCFLIFLKNCRGVYALAHGESLPYAVNPVVFVGSSYLHFISPCASNYSRQKWSLCVR